MENLFKTTVSEFKRKILKRSKFRGPLSIITGSNELIIKSIDIEKEVGKGTLKRADI